MSYQIRQCTWQSGERYCMLVDADTGMPPWYPMLFITTQFRNPGHSVATMEAALGAIQLLLDFTESTARFERQPQYAMDFAHG